MLTVKLLYDRILISSAFKFEFFRGKYFIILIKIMPSRGVFYHHCSALLFLSDIVRSKKLNGCW